MLKLMKMNNGWRWRDGELSYKEFVKLPQQEKDEYVLSIENVPATDRSSTDEIILNRFGKSKKNNYFTLNEEYE